MRTGFGAVIFDMDGVLIESEHLWRKAMIMGFSEYGMQVTEDECRKTMGMRIDEVIGLWLAHFKLPANVAPALEKRVIDLLLDFIEKEGRPMPGIPQLVAFCAEKRLKLGLATSSSVQLMDAVLKKLDLAGTMDAAVSAEKLRYAKPHPEVFLNCASALGVMPEACLVIEDSINGVIAARAARMTVIAVPEADQVVDITKDKQFGLADYRFGDMHQVLRFFRTLLA